MGSNLYPWHQSHPAAPPKGLRGPPQPRLPTRRPPPRLPHPNFPNGSRHQPTLATTPGGPGSTGPPERPGRNPPGLDPAGNPGPLLPGRAWV